MKKIYLLGFVFLVLISVGVSSEYNWTDGEYNYISFNTTGNHTWVKPLNLVIGEILIVGGGGGSGYGTATTNINGGGGGAGGLIYIANYTFSKTNYFLEVGAGGLGSSLATNVGSNGISSVFNNLVASGGGGGGSSSSRNGNVGGSGGGGGVSGTNVGNGGVSNQSINNSIYVNSGFGSVGGGSYSGTAGGGGGAGGGGSYPTAGIGKAYFGLIFSVGGTAGGGGGSALNNTGNGGNGTATNIAGSFAGGSGVIILKYKPVNNSIIINIYNEKTNTELTGNFNLTILSEFETQQTITSGFGLVDLDEGTYVLTISGQGYSSRSYSVSIANGEYKTLDVYLINSTNDVDFYIKDIYGQALDKAVLNAERSINGSWVLVSSMTSDIAGQTTFIYDETASYKFTGTKSGYENKAFVLSPIKNNLYNVYLTPSQQYSINQSLLGVSINYYVNPYTLNNVTLLNSRFKEKQLNNFTLVISSPNGYLLDYGYNLSYKGNSITGVGSNSYGSSFSDTLNITESGLLDKVYLRYYYNSSIYGYFEFTQEFYISQDISGGQIADLKRETYGLGMLERVIIVIIVAGIFGGLIGLLNGALAGGVAIMFIFAYFLYSGFLEVYLVALPIALILFYIFRGGD
jgi:hypothetical protein